MAEKKKKITVDGLARMIQGEFSNINKQLEKLDKLEVNVNNLKVGQNKILNRLEGVDKERVDGIDTRVKNLEDLFAMPAKK